MVVELHKRGKSSNEIGRELGIPRDMVRRWIRVIAASDEGRFLGIGKQVFSLTNGKSKSLRKY